jgi:hypothetical protein
VVIVPVEKDLHAVLARFAQARIEHDVRPAGCTSGELEGVAYTLCVMTGARTVEQVLPAADALLQYSASGASIAQQDETLAA